MDLIDRVAAVIGKIELLIEKTEDPEQKAKMVKLVQLAKDSIEIIVKNKTPCPAHLEPMVITALDSLEKSYAKKDPN